MPQKASLHTSHKSTAERIRDLDSFEVELPGLGHMRLPRPEHLAYYGGLAALAALSLLEWPIALVLGAGHALEQNHHSRVAQELGDALGEA